MIDELGDLPDLDEDQGQLLIFELAQSRYGPNSRHC